MSFETEGAPLLSGRGEEALTQKRSDRRPSPVHPAEELVARAGQGLFLLHSDAARLAYVAVYRERRLAWSLLLQDDARLVRCDGQVVRISEPPRFVPEGDRMGVLHAGLEQWLRAPVPLDEEARYLLAEELSSWSSGTEAFWIVRNGLFVEDASSAGRVRASG